MGLGSVMTNALSGLRVTQSGLDVVSQNISNADSAGYIRRRSNVSEQPIGDQAGFARVAGVQRMLDKVVQKQLWNETSGSGYTATKANMLGALDQVYGPPDSSSSLGSVMSKFTNAIQQMKSDPANYTLRTGVVAAGQEMAGRLRSLSGGIQDLRGQAEEAISAAVNDVNRILTQIQANDGKILDANGGQSSSPALLDERDKLLTELASYMDIRTSDNGNGSFNIFTTSGVTLFAGSNATKLSFDPAASVGADQLYNPDPALSGVGILRAETGFGGSVDLLANNSIRSGELAALVELRDKTLVTAQNQLDELAANMASALSDREVNGAAVVAGAATGFDVDTVGLLAGNQITLDYTDSTTGQAARFTFVKADSAGAVTGIATSGLSSGDNRVIGINFSLGMASVITQIQAAVGAGFTVSNPAGTTLRIVDDGAGNTRDVNALVARPTVTTTTGPQPAPPAAPITEFPFFIDTGVSGGIYAGSFEGKMQMRGLSARIDVNKDVVSNRALLVQYSSTSTIPQGDQTRPVMMYQRLTGQVRVFSTQTGVGGTSTSYRASIQDFGKRLIETQGSTIQSAASLNEGQQIALKAVEARFTEKSGVNIDQEMSSLVELQNAYSANARVISAVREMMDLLLRL